MLTNQIMMSAIQGDRKTAAVLPTTCKTIYSWVVPVLYSTVVLTHPKQAVAFADCLRRSAHWHRCAEQGLEGGKQDPCFPRCAVGAYVRRLWLGPTSTELNCALEAWYRDHERDGRHRGQPIDSLLSHCTALRSLVTQHCPLGVDMKTLINSLSQTLESLCIFPCIALEEDENIAFINSTLHVPNISRLTSLREVTSVHQPFSFGMEQLLASGGMPSLRDATEVCTYPTINEPREALLWGIITNQFCRAVRHDTFSTCPRRNVVVVARRDDEAILWEIEEELLDCFDTPIPGWVWPSHLTICGKQGRNEEQGLDEIKYLYNDWFSQVDHSSPCCVDLEQIEEHVSLC